MFGCKHLKLNHVCVSLEIVSDEHSILDLTFPIVTLTPHNSCFATWKWTQSSLERANREINRLSSRYEGRLLGYTLHKVDDGYSMMLEYASVFYHLQ